MKTLQKQIQYFQIKHQRFLIFHYPCRDYEWTVKTIAKLIYYVYLGVYRFWVHRGMYWWSAFTIMFFFPVNTFSSSRIAPTFTYDITKDPKNKKEKCSKLFRRTRNFHKSLRRNWLIYFWNFNKFWRLLSELENFEMCLFLQLLFHKTISFYV